MSSFQARKAKQETGLMRDARIRLMLLLLPNNPSTFSITTPLSPRSAARHEGVIADFRYNHGMPHACYRRRVSAFARRAGKRGARPARRGA
jgi:hypothetical protein